MSNLWLIVEWKNGVGISYEPSSKLTLLEDHNDWVPGAQVKQWFQRTLYTGKILSTWQTKAAAVECYDLLVKPQNDLPKKRKIKVTKKVKDQEDNQENTSRLSASSETISNQHSKSSQKTVARSDVSDDNFDEEQEVGTFMAGLKRKNVERSQNKMRCQKKPKSKKKKASKTSAVTIESDESDDNQVEFSSLPHVINDSCGDEDDDEQKENKEYKKECTTREKVAVQAKKKISRSQAKQDDNLKRDAELTNLKMLFQSAQPKHSSTPVASPNTTTTDSPRKPLTPILPPHAPHHGMYYTECDGCKKHERRIEKLEGELQKIRKILQKTCYAPKVDKKPPADEPSAIPKIVQLPNVLPTEKEKDTSIVMPSADHEPEEGITMESSCNEDPGVDSFAMPADSLLHAEVKASRSPGVAERNLLTMMFPMETLMKSSVMGRRIRKNEPPKTPLDRHLLNKLIELVKNQWPERSEEKIINSLNTRMKEIRQNTTVEANKKE